MDWPSGAPKDDLPSRTGARSMLDNPFARRGILALWDIGSWGLATAVVIGVRHDFNLSEVLWESVIVYWLLTSNFGAKRASPTTAGRSM